MVADVVARAEVLMGVVIESTPTDGTRNLVILIGIIDAGGMTESLFKPPVHAAKLFGRVHVAVMFGHEFGLVFGFPSLWIIKAVVQSKAREVVIAIDVFKAVRAFEVPDADGGSCRINGMAIVIGFLVEFVIIWRFVYSNTVGNKGRVVHFLGHHALKEIIVIIPPGLIFANVLPARDFV